MENDKQKIDYAITGGYDVGDRPNTEIIFSSDDIEETKEVFKLLEQAKENVLMGKDYAKLNQKQLELLREIENKGVAIKEDSGFIFYIAGLKIVEIKEDE